MKPSLSFHTSSRGILKQSDLSAFLDADIKSLHPTKSKENCDGIIGWGNKPNTKSAKDFAQSNNLPFYCLEDSFLGYFGHPSKRNIRVGLIKDSRGIYYDAYHSSDLDHFLQSPLSDEENKKSTDDLNYFKSLHLSKYNDPNIDFGARVDLGDYVLLIDQTYGDQSISSGGSSQDCFLWMLLDALHLYPNSKIVIRTHPDVKAGKKTGCFNKSWLNISDRIVLNDDPINALDLIKSAQAVFCVTSQMGFESIIHDKKVFTYSSAFYTCLDLSEDRLTFLEALSTQEREDYFKSINNTSYSLDTQSFDRLISCHQKKKSARQSSYWMSLSHSEKIIALFHCAMKRYAIYVHPDTRSICSLRDILDWFAVQAKFKLHTQSPIIMHGFSLWKKWFIPAYIPFKHRSQLVFTQTSAQLKKQLNNGSDIVITWGAVRCEKIAPVLNGQTLFCVEDGFIRSQGLGVDLKRPSSLCFDDLSIYYNSLKPSRLNSILQNSLETQCNLEQAQFLIAQISENGLSKYNVGQELESDIKNKILKAKENNKEIILIPGQVMGDASLKYGTSDINSNSKLIEQVVKDFPNAFLIYKPHPDVYASKKGDFTELTLANKHCSLVLKQQNIALLYPFIDRLCTMTSLSGFEALLRGIQVDCYGKPFYSGWGLTNDHQEIPQRTNKLSLEQLVGATLVEYPLYVNWQTWTFMQPEVLVKQLSHTRVKIKPSGFISKMRKKLGYLFELYKMSRSQY